MNTIELQNKIIHKVLEINNKDFLDYLNSLLTTENLSAYKLNEFEKTIIEESIIDYKSGNTVSNEDVFKKTEKWLEE